MSDKKKKEKKEKVTYIDDGRTIVDMSGLGKGGYGDSKGPKPHSTAREKWQTYWAAVKMMFFPMLIVIGILIATYLIMYFALS